jgi:hypothetical protein
MQRNYLISALPRRLFCPEFLLFQFLSKSRPNVKVKVRQFVASKSHFVGVYKNVQK